MDFMNKNMLFAFALVGFSGLVAVETIKLGTGTTTTTTQQTQAQPVANNGIIAGAVSLFVATPLAFVKLTSLSDKVNAHPYYTLITLAALTAGGYYGVNALLEAINEDENN